MSTSSRTRSRRSFAIKPQGIMQSDINVTPLVDVVLVLLLIFMVVTPLAEKDLAVKIATTAAGVAHEATPASTQERLVVHLGAKGDLRVNDDAVADQDYQRNLAARLATRSAEDQVVVVVADDRARYAKLVAVMDGAKKAGARVVGLAAEGPQH